MAKKPYSDTEIRPESGEVARFLRRHQYDSPEWSADADIENRGLGVREVDDPNVSKEKQDTLPQYGK